MTTTLVKMAETHPAELREKLMAMRSSGKTLTEMAAIFGVCFETASRAARKAGLPPGTSWPKGLRRHQALADGKWESVRKELAEFLGQYRQRNGHGISMSAVAIEVGVHVTAVLKWLRGENWPSPERHEKIKAWMEEKKSLLSPSAQAEWGAVLARLAAVFARASTTVRCSRNALANHLGSGGLGPLISQYLRREKWPTPERKAKILVWVEKMELLLTRQLAAC